MRTYHTEFAHDYSTYAFGYQVHAELESGDDPHLPYEHGFLPRSNQPERTNLFYLARSVRVPVARFTPDSENRRVLRKFDGTLTYDYLTREQLKTDGHFRTLFLSYFDERHGIGIMDEKRLNGILDTVLPLRAVRYLEADTPVAYALEIANESFLHYWYPVYEMSKEDKCFGMWLMLDSIRRAHAEGKAYVYLGTSYGEKGRYKTNIAPLEYWDGETWRTGAAELRAHIKHDAGLIFKRTD